MSTTALSAAPRTATVFAVIPSPVGPLTLIGTGDALTACLFDGAAIVAASPHLTEDPAPFAEATEQFASYFAGSLRDFDLALDPHGTDFQRRVWAELGAIPYGETRPYGPLATNLGSPGPSRQRRRAVVNSSLNSGVGPSIVMERRSISWAEPGWVNSSARTI